MIDFHHPAQAIRAPHADPFGQFRGAPLNRKRRARYSVVVVLILAVLGLVPYLIDATLPEPEGSQMTVDGAHTDFVNTDAEWPLRFDVLEECDVVRNPVALYFAQFDCGDWDARVMGMAQVDNDLSAMALAANRSIRAMESADVEDMAPHDITTDVKLVKPDVLEATGADAVLMTDPFQWGWVEDNGAHGGTTMNYAVSFFRAYDMEGVDQGSLVTVEISTKPRAANAGPGDAALMDEAFGYAMKVIDGAHAKDGVTESKQEGLINV